MDIIENDLASPGIIESNSPEVNLGDIEELTYLTRKLIYLSSLHSIS